MLVSILDHDLAGASLSTDILSATLSAYARGRARQGGIGFWFLV
jgi:hypothetical protein